MKILFSLFVPILLFTFSTEWQWFTSEKGAFTILAPGEMTERSDEVETAVGTLTYHTYLYKPESEDADNFLYMVSYCDYPEGGMHSDSVDLLEDFFDATVESSVFSIKGELFYASDIRMGEYPGKIWRVNYGNNEAAIKTKAFMVNSRYYAVQTVTLRDKSLNPSIDKFLDSFKVISENEQN